MLEQSVVKRNSEREYRLRRALRIIQLVLFAALVLGLVFGFSLFSPFMDADPGFFWNGMVNILLLALPVALVLGILEWHISRMGVEYDYLLSDSNLSVWRVSGNKRKLWLSFSLSEVSFLKPYAELSETEAEKLKKVIFACCNSDSPDLCLVEAQRVRIGKRIRPAALLMEPNEAFQRSLKSALTRNQLL